MKLIIETANLVSKPTGKHVSSVTKKVWAQAGHGPAV
jgi:hypothetical protein